MATAVSDAINIKKSSSCTMSFVLVGLQCSLDSPSPSVSILCQVCPRPSRLCHLPVDTLTARIFINPTQFGMRYIIPGGKCVEKYNTLFRKRHDLSFSSKPGSVSLWFLNTKYVFCRYVWFLCCGYDTGGIVRSLEAFS